MEDTHSRVDALQARVTALETILGRLGVLTSSSAAILTYPEPLATSLAKEIGARFHHERFFGLLDAGEICIQYTGAMTLALCKSSQPNLDLQSEFRRPVSLGGWAELIREKCSSCDVFSDHPIGRVLRASLFRPNGRPTPTGRYIMEEFINLRNRERGHASSLPEEAYESLHLRHTTEIHDALESCAYLMYPLVRVESVDVVTEPLSYDVRLLIGPPPLTAIRRIQSPTRVQPGMTCVWDRGEVLLNLDDLVIYRACPVCNVEHTFFLEQWADNTRHYRAYAGNHRFRESQ